MGDFYFVLPGKIREYFRSRSEQCYRKSTFNACEYYACGRPCCTDYIGIEITGFDLIAAALVSNIQPFEIFNKNVTVKLDPFHTPGKIVTKLHLKTPCSFLSEDGCNIHRDKKTGRYVGKPLSCTLFPEDLYLLNQQDVPEKVKTEHPEIFGLERKSWPCLKEKPALGKERTEALLNLEVLAEQERVASDAYFELGSLEYKGRLPKNEKEAKVLSRKLKEDFNSNFGRETQFYARLEVKAAALNCREGVEELFCFFKGENPPK